MIRSARRSFSIISIGAATLFHDSRRDAAVPSAAHVPAARASGTAVELPPATQRVRTLSGPLLWGSLAPGAYGVGFKVIELTDYSRIWGRVRDARGGMERELPRPIRVSIWYPATHTTSDSMRFRSYVFYHSASPAGMRADAFLSGRDSTAYARGDFGGDGALMTKLLTTRTAATLNAVAASGQFPVVLYAAGWNSLSPDNTVLAEFLASHGFVVATVPQLPRADGIPELSVSAADITVQERDLDFALGFLVASARNVNPSAVALVGYSMGGVVQLVQGAHRANVRALVGLDPSYVSGHWTALTGSLDGFDPWKLRMPALVLRSGGAAAEESSQTILGRLGYQDRYAAAVGTTSHGDFSDFPSIVAAMHANFPAGASLAAAQASHDDIDRCVLAFLESTVGPKVGRSPKFEPARCAPIQLLASPGAPIPATAELLDSLASSGYDRTRAIVGQLTSRYPTLSIVSEAELNSAAYELLRKGQKRRAVDAFLLNAFAHPASANSYDSLADGYEFADDTTGYLAALRKALALVDGDSSLSNVAKQAIRARARKALRSNK
jgi:hypothetical protein